MTEGSPEGVASEALAVDKVSQGRGAYGSALFRNSLAQMLNVVANGLTGLVLTRIVIQQLGLASYGLFGTALSFAILFGVLADLGFSLLTVREMNREPIKAAETFARLTMSRLAVGLCVLLLAGGASYILYYPAIVRSGIFLLSIATVTSGLTLQFGAYFQARLESSKLTWSLLVGNVIRLVLVVVFLVLWSAGLYAIFSAYLIGALVGLAVSVWLAREVIPAFGHSALGIFGLRSAAILGVIYVLDIFHFRVDMLLLSLLRTPEEVGAYSVAYRVFESLIMLGMAFSTAFYSVLTRAFGEDDTEGARRLIQRCFNGLSGVSLGLIPLGIVGAPLAVFLLTGDSVSASSNTLRVLMFCLPVILSGPIFNLTLVSLNRQNWLIAVSCGALIFNVLLNLLFIPWFGVVGAALATLISETFALGARLILSVYILDLHISLRRVARYAAASSATVAILLGVTSLVGSQPITDLGVLAIGALIYGVCCLAFGAISWNAALRTLRYYLSAGISSRSKR